MNCPDCHEPLRVEPRNQRSSLPYNASLREERFVPDCGPMFRVLRIRCDCGFTFDHEEEGTIDSFQHWNELLARYEEELL